MLWLENFISKGLINTQKCSKLGQNLFLHWLLDNFLFEFFFLNCLNIIEMIFLFFLIFISSIESIYAFEIHHFMDIWTWNRIRTDFDLTGVTILHVICVFDGKIDRFFELPNKSQIKSCYFIFQNIRTFLRIRHNTLNLMLFVHRQRHVCDHWTQWAI